MFIGNLSFDNKNYKRLDVLLYKNHTFSFFGLGFTNSLRVLAKLGLNRFYNFLLCEKYFSKLLELYFYHNLKYVLSLDLRFFVLYRLKKILNNKFLYKSQRHFLCLSIRGQRTRKNALTQKSKKIKGILPSDSVSRRFLKNLDKV